MKEITINGVSYLPASALAKQFRYTTDYIGQLCRAKKVDAQLIGRSWYVNPLSLTAHKTGRYAKPAATKEIEVESQETKSEEVKIAVEPVIAKKTARLAAQVPQHFAKRIEWKPLKYESDEGDLLPKVKREIDPVKVVVDLADSTDIAIKTASKLTTLVAEELPTVSLRGKVKVASLEESFDIEEEQAELDIPVPEPVTEPLPAEKTEKKAFLHNTLPSREAVLKQKAQKQAIVRKPVPSPFTPSNVVAITGEEEEVGIIHITLATTSGVLVLLLVLVFFAESTISADALSYEWGMHFSTQSLTALASLFSK